MNIDNASNFLISSILLSVGIIVFVASLTAINNILHKYWKPVTIFSVDSWTLFGSAAADRYVENHPQVIAERKAKEENIIQTFEEPTLNEKGKR